MKPENNVVNLAVSKTHRYEAGKRMCERSGRTRAWAALDEAERRWWIERAVQRGPVDEPEPSRDVEPA